MTSMNFGNLVHLCALPTQDKSEKWSKYILLIKRLLNAKSI